MKFRALVWRYYRAHGRHELPWRHTHDAYRILVSEVMLQQTQVERVIPFYEKFIKKFPTARKLAQASLSEVLKSWQGLGYNRRAKMLHAAAKEFAPRKISTVSELETLPGVGPYTARAVAAFAFNKGVIFVETNIRTAVIHHFFPKRGESRVGRAAESRFSPKRKKVRDEEIEKILIQALPKGRAREWYSALMDYGAHLKRSGISHNARSKKYVKQSKFVGSLREARGAILRELVRGAASPARLIDLLGASRRAQMRTALRALWTEKLVEKADGNYTLAQ
jgi:A/G-specific adenine glycosylase